MKTLMNQFRELAIEYYQLVIVEKRPFNDPLVMDNLANHDYLMSKHSYEEMKKEVEK
jgi:hypothetical protein